LLSLFTYCFHSIVTKAGTFVYSSFLLLKENEKNKKAAPLSGSSTVNTGIFGEGV